MLPAWVILVGKEKEGIVLNLCDCITDKYDLLSRSKHHSEYAIRIHDQFNWLSYIL